MSTDHGMEKTYDTKPMREKVEDFRRKLVGAEPLLDKAKLTPTMDSWARALVRASDQNAQLALSLLDIIDSQNTLLAPILERFAESRKQG